MMRYTRKLWRGFVSLLLALLLLPGTGLTVLAVELPQAVTYHFLTVSPNGGAFADGSSEAKTFQLRSTGYMKPEDYQSAGFNQQYAGLTRSGYLPSGYGTSKSGPVTVGLYELANTRFTEDTTLYVIWGKAVQMTIYANGGMLFQYTPDGAVSLDDPYVTMVPAGDPIPVSVLNRMAVRDDYSFAGLSTDAAGEHSVFPELRDGEACYVAPDENVTYYVQWVRAGEVPILLQPNDVTLPIGQTAVFFVSANGDDLTYQWQFCKNGKWENSGMTGSKTAAISVPVTAARNGQQYRCIITNANGNKVTSNAAKLLVKTVITAQPKNVTASVGETAQFTVSATGAGLTYQWQFCKGGKWENSGMTGSKTATISVPVTAARNGQQYRCVITDANGNKVTSNAAKLLVKTVITAQPKNVTASVGETAQFTVSATGAGLTYQWQFCKGGKWENSGMTGSKTVTISVPVTAARNGQQYRCVITDANGNKVTSNAAKLLVKTVITAQPKNVTASVGETAQFTVSATGAGLTYQWQFCKGGKWESSGMTGSKTATISVPVTAARNGQQYRCVITDTNGNKVTSNAAKLLVKTVITAQPKNMTASVGETAQFTVSATGAGLTYQWQFCKDGKWENSGMTGSKTATISVPATAARNGQQYRCIITDANGNKVISNAAKLTVK